MLAERITVFGGGSWGTALAWLLGRRGFQVTLWCRDEGLASAIQAERRNARYLPDLVLPPGVTATGDIQRASSGADLYVLAVPVQGLREVVRRLRDHASRTAALALAAKGLETATGMRVSQVALEAGDPAWRERLAVLSGPNLAGELVRELPTTTVVAAWNADLARRLQDVFSAPFLRVYTNGDVTGVELGGALKNPIAIAAGISDGLGFGNNSKAALITRGLAEMARLGCACGARPATFAGLSGLGDLVATCGSRLSRNYRLGLALGRGAPLEAALRELGQVAEGVPTCEAACALAERHGVDMPITTELRQVLVGAKAPREAVLALMAREFRGETPDGA